MQTMNQSLSDLVKRHLITKEDALNRSTLVEELLQLLAHEGPAATAGGSVSASPFAKR
jgi:Tfp pilus assembly ATPase PilU